MLTQRFRRFVSLLALVSAAAGCSSDGAGAITGPPPAEDGELIFFGRSGLITCPNYVPQTGLLTVDPLLGGVLSLPGASVSVPAGAVLETTVFSVTVPITRYAEVQIVPLGLSHFLFEKEIEVSIDYGRCWRPELDAQPLEAWHVSTLFRTKLEQMPSVDDKVARRVTFRTNHLSSYALAE